MEGLVTSDLLLGGASEGSGLLVGSARSLGSFAWFQMSVGPS